MTTAESNTPDFLVSPDDEPIDSDLEFVVGDIDELGAQGNPERESHHLSDLVLGPDDFQRIGLQPSETRLPVIRSAANRTSKSLAARQLKNPTRATEEQLYRVAVSTYRVLDPRQRQVARESARVGRILPGALLYAARMIVSSAWRATSSKAARATESTGRTVTSRAANGEESSSSGAESSRDSVTNMDSTAIGASHTPTPFVDEIEKRYQSDRQEYEFTTGSEQKSWLERPITIITLTVILFVAAIALWIWGQQQRQGGIPVGTRDPGREYLPTMQLSVRPLVERRAWDQLAS